MLFKAKFAVLMLTDTKFGNSRLSIFVHTNKTLNFLLDENVL